MSYTKASMRATDKYVKEHYRRVVAQIPKSRKEAVIAYAREHDGSVNALINRLLRTELGISNIDWKYH